MKFIATKASVAEHGHPPDDYLTESVNWAKGAQDEIFVPRRDDIGERDIYTMIAPYLAPWKSLIHRKAAMLEVLRVLAAFESSWKWGEGRDVSNPAENDPDTISAGVFQISFNSRDFGADLRAMIAGAGIADGDRFQHVMKHDRGFCFEYTARLLRHTIRHNGPTKRLRDTAKYHDSIYSRLSTDAVEEWMQLIVGQDALN